MLGDELNIVGGPDCCNEATSSLLTKECYVDTLLGRLQRKKQRAEAELASANAALDALRNNPEVTNILELISRASR